MELFVPTCFWMLSSVTPWLLFAYFMLFLAWNVLSPPSSLGMEIGTWMALRFWYIGTVQWYAVVCCGTRFPRVHGHRRPGVCKGP